jgi:hypothetical protein
MTQKIQHPGADDGIVVGIGPVSRHWHAAHVVLTPT